MKGAVLLAALALSASAGARTPAPPYPVAIELFTSQGCSSCPPADALFIRLAREPGVVAITRPVTYWDRLGWKDTLARPANTELQRGYARRKISGGGTYTPQAVVQGRAGTVGGRETMIRQLAAQAARLTEPKLLIARVGNGRSIALSGEVKAAAIVSVVHLRPMVGVRIGGGENGGRIVRYANVVNGETVLGTWRGGAARYTFIPPQTRSVQRYAVIVRQGEAGPILAARNL